MAANNDQERALALARTYIRRGNLCFFDTETTGLEPQDQVVSWGIYLPDGEVRAYGLVRPTVAVQEGARRVHGLGDARLAKAPRLHRRGL